MRYLLLLSILLLFASCKKDNGYYNPSRGVFVGNYHFTQINYHYGSRDTIAYDGSVVLLNPDDGRSIIVTYPSTEITVLHTSDSSFTAVEGCIHGNPGISGGYSHGNFGLYDNTGHCLQGIDAVSTLSGIKY